MKTQQKPKNKNTILLMPRKSSQRRGENFTVTSIRSDGANLVTRRETRQGIFFMDLKRYYHNIDESVGYGHPSILEPAQSAPAAPAPRPAKRAREGELILETNKRHKKYMKPFLKDQ